MERQYTKYANEKSTDILSLKDAIKVEDYTKCYFLNETAIERIDYFEPGVGLSKVSYHQVKPPFETIVSVHFQKYPHVLCEVNTPPVDIDVGVAALHTHLFQTPGHLESHYEHSFDQGGRLVKKFKVGQRNKPLNEEQINYDGQCVSSTLYSYAGG